MITMNMMIINMKESIIMMKCMMKIIIIKTSIKKKINMKMKKGRAYKAKELNMKILMIIIRKKKKYNIPIIAIIEKKKREYNKIPKIIKAIMIIKNNNHKNNNCNKNLQIGMMMIHFFFKVLNLIMNPKIKVMYSKALLVIRIKV